MNSEIQKSENVKEIVRILQTDIKGETNLYSALTQIKGISWNLSNALCYMLKLDKTRKIGSLDDTEIKEIQEGIRNLYSSNLPSFLLNRPKVLDGERKHLIGSDLDLQLRMDIKGLRDIQSYKGIRHALGLPVRGQRTKSNFRRGRSVGVIKKKNVPKPKAKAKPKTGGKKK